MSESTVESAADVYENYKKLRKDSPVSQDEGGSWQVARHVDVQYVMKDNKSFSSDVSLRPAEERTVPSMLFSDPPVHNRLRKLVSHAFKPAHIESQRDLIADRCESLVTKMCDSSQPDLVDSLAAPLPVTVIAHMLGVPESNNVQFKHWSDTIFSNIGDILLANPSKAAQKASAEMDAYFLERIAILREHPENHLLGRLIETETEDGHLSNEELLSFCRLLLIAGNETTTGLITGMVRVFSDQPEIFDAIKATPSLIPTFIEETLRVHSPFSLTIRRTTCDTELAGVKIPAGDLVLPLIACANRDETVFECPEEFVIDRDPNPHLAFGYGIHNCLGAHLARLEGQIAVASLTKHLDSISLADQDESQFSQLGGPSRLLVNIHPKS